MLVLAMFYLYFSRRSGNPDGQQLEIRQNTNQPCLLSASESKYSWVANVRCKRDSNTICVGIVVAPSALVMPAICVSKFDIDGGFFAGHELEAVAGGENGSCSQKRAGRIIENAFALHPVVIEPQPIVKAGSGYVLSVTRLYVEDFDIDKVSSPLSLFSKMLPQSEEEAKNLLNELQAANSTDCSLPIVFDKNGNKTFKVFKVIPIKDYECAFTYCDANHTENCPGLKWSPETIVCFVFDVEDPESLECDDIVSGSPLVCGGKLLGFLKHCEGGTKPFLIQRMTREALEMIAKEFSPFDRGTLHSVSLSTVIFAIVFHILAALVSRIWPINKSS